MERAWRGRRMRQALKLDRQLGGGGVADPIGRHWEEECAASMVCLYELEFDLPILVGAMQQCEKCIAITAPYPPECISLRVRFISTQKVFEKQLIASAKSCN
jgi:hypothetical protein